MSTLKKVDSYEEMDMQVPSEHVVPDNIWVEMRDTDDKQKMNINPDAIDLKVKSHEIRTSNYMT